MSGNQLFNIVSIAVALLIATGLRAQELPRVERTSDCLATVPDGINIEFQSDCGYVVVPQSRNGGVQGEVRLPYMRIHSAAPKRDAPLFMLAGGPGGTIVKNITLALLEPELLGGVLDTRDIVLIDQRGTYNSKPYLDCPGYDALPFVALRDRLDPDATDALARKALTVIGRMVSIWLPTTTSRTRLM